MIDISNNFNIQQTIAESVSINGIGLHSGRNVTMKLCPAEDDYGIKFFRTDLNKNKANYLAFGAFYLTKTKKVKHKANIKILNAAKKLSKTPIVAIGGINSSNYKNLLLNNSNFLAI